MAAHLYSTNIGRYTWDRFRNSRPGTDLPGTRLALIGKPVYHKEFPLSSHLQKQLQALAQPGARGADILASIAVLRKRACALLPRANWPRHRTRRAWAPPSHTPALPLTIQRRYWSLLPRSAPVLKTACNYWRTSTASPTNISTAKCCGRPACPVLWPVMQAYR